MFYIPNVLCLWNICYLEERWDENINWWTNKNELLKMGFQMQRQGKCSWNFTTCKSGFASWFTDQLWCMEWYCSPGWKLVLGKAEKILIYYTGWWLPRTIIHKEMHSISVVLKFHGGVWLGKKSLKRLWGNGKVNENKVKKHCFMRMFFSVQWK